MPRNILSAKEKARRVVLGMGDCKVIKVGNERVLEYCEAGKNDKMYIPQGVTELGEKSLKVWYNCDIEIPETVQKSSLDILVIPKGDLPKEYRVSLTNPPLDLALALVSKEGVKLELHGDYKNVVVAWLLRRQLHYKGDWWKDFDSTEDVWNVNGLVVKDYLTKEIIEYVRTYIYSHSEIRNSEIREWLMIDMFCFEKWTRALGY